MGYKQKEGNAEIIYDVKISFFMIGTHFSKVDFTAYIF